MSDLVDDGQTFVQAMINDGNLEPENRLAGMVLFAAFEYGPRAGLIARRLGADLGVVGQMVENLDAAQYWGEFDPKRRHRGISAEWPELLVTAQPSDELVTGCILSFMLDTLVAEGRLMRRVDEAGAITYWPQATATPTAEKPAEGSKSCTRCHIVKPLSEFYRRSERGTYVSRCKKCTAGAQRDWQKRRLERESLRCGECGGPRGYGSARLCRNCYSRTGT